MTEGEADKASKNGGSEAVQLTKDDDMSLEEDFSIHSNDLRVDVKDLINLGAFEKARTVKPIKDQKPGYAKFMPYCQIICVATLILALICLILGYKTYEVNPTKAEKFKYAGFAMSAVGVIAFIAVIYINSVSENNLIDTMRSFRRSKAANPQINKKLENSAGHDH